MVMNGMTFFVMEQSKKLHRAEDNIACAKREIAEIDKQIARHENDEEAVGLIHRLQLRKRSLEQRIYYEDVQAKKIRRMGIR